MLTRRVLVWLDRAALGLALACVMVALCGCATSRKVDQLMAQTEEQAKRAAVTEAVLLKLAERDNGVVPDILASVEEGSMVAWAHAKRAIRTDDNKPLLDSNGSAQYEVVQAIGKSRSGREFIGAKRGRLKLAGVAYDFETGKIDPNAILEGSSLEIIFDTGSSKADAEWAKVMADAIANEKTAILSGMATLATARGAAYAVRVKALTDGVAEIATTAGAIVGQVIRTATVPTTADLAAAGVTKLIEAVIKTDDGTKTVLAADTAASTAASDCEGCYEDGK